MKLIFSFFVLNFIIFTAYTQKTNVILIPYYDVRSGLYGYLDSATNISKIPPKYNFASYFNNNFSIVKLNGKFGILNKLGKEITNYEYDIIGSFNNGFCTVASGNKWGFIDTLGKEIIGCKYDYISDFDNNIAKFLLNNKWGIIDSKGNEIILPVYNYISNINEKIIIANKLTNDTLKFGCIDNKGNILVPFIYDSIIFDKKSENLKLYNNLILAYKNKKYGIISIDGEIVLPFLFDKIEIWFSSEFILAKINDKYGLYNNIGKEIIPAIYSSISIYNNEVNLFKAEVYKVYTSTDTLEEKKYDYFTKEGDKDTEGEKKWNFSLFHKIELSDIKFNFNAKLVNTNGPFGCEPKSFFIDKNNNYWLSINSDGCIFFSDNCGKSWKLINDGIKNENITSINSFNDTLFIKTKTQNFFYYDSNKLIWNKINKKYYLNLNKKFYALAKLNKENVIKSYPVDISHNLYFLSDYCSNQNLNDSIVNRIYGFSIDKPELANLNKFFPKDVFESGSGNLYLNKKNNLFILSNSGIYSLENKKKFIPITNNISYSKIKQLVKTKDGSCIALTNNSKIWKYSNDKWDKIFDINDETISDSIKTNFHSFEIKELIVSYDDNILFCYDGNIWQIDNSGKKEVVQPKLHLTKYKTPLINTSDTITFENEYLIFICAAKDRKGIIWSIARIYSEKNEKYKYVNNNKFALVKYDIALKKFNITDLFEDNLLPFFITDKIGKIWLKKNKSIKQIGFGAVPESNINISEEICTPAKFAVDNSGKIAFCINQQQKNIIKIWIPDLHKWNNIFIDTLLNSIDCISFDNSSNIIAVTNTKKGEAEIYKLSYIKNRLLWKKISNQTDFIITSITPDLKNGIMIGTEKEGVFIVNTNE